MAHNMLSEIHKDNTHWTIYVLVSHMWHYCGGTDEGPIKHTDLVLLDSEGTHIYGQLPPEPAEKLKDVLQEGKVFVIRKFLCNASKTTYIPVESAFMVQFTNYTTVEEKHALADTFTFCTYSLTAFVDIPRARGGPARFFDVVGRISIVFYVVLVQSMHQTAPSNTRTIMLEDLLGNTIRLVLWGDRVAGFDADTVRAMGAKEPVIAIFVGTLPKMAFGVKGLIGISACRSYIDEDIPDINSIRNGLGDKFAPLATYDPVGPGALVPRVHEDPTNKTVKELDELDPFEDMEKRFCCTITISRFDPDQRWWFHSCSMCRKSTKHDGFQYRCSDDTCSSVEADLMYCVSVFTADDTVEAEFILFDRVAARAVGKSLMAILRQKYRGYNTASNLANATRNDAFVLDEITNLVGKKYRMLVSISKRWKSQKNTDKLAFQVNRIEETFKPELPPLVFDNGSGSIGSSSLGVGSSSQVPSVGPVLWPASHVPRTHSSPANQTPPPTVRLSPSTPATWSSAPKCGARRSLFNTPLKETKEPAMDHVLDGQLLSEAVMGGSAISTDVKDDQFLSPNTKPAAGDKDDA
uniref:Uncharacterized protein n=1 Tax=Avena sativa TaxID=4498 RepID=A0ACD6A059_AVESA